MIIDIGKMIIAVLVGIILSLAIVMNVRLYKKAGADIRAANAQERIAEALEEHNRRTASVRIGR